jgi:hypothetical protein
LKNVSPSLRLRVSEHIFDEVLKMNEIFKKIESKVDEGSIVKYVVNKLDIKLTSPEEVLIAQDSSIEQNDEMYFVAKGQCLVKIKDIRKLNKDEKKVRVLYPGDYFGVSYVC